MFRSIQSKLVFVYLLLILVAFQLSGLYLLKQLEGAYVRQVTDDLHRTGQLLVGQLSNYTMSGKVDAQAIATFMQHWPGNVLVLDSNGTVIGATPQPEYASLVGKKFTHDDVSPIYGGAQESAHTGEENGQRMAFEALPITSATRLVG
ncbi:MAG: hypothetical protein ACM3XM_17930, partial [Mycobacterium leprae]